MRRRRVSLLSSQGLVMFGLIPGLIALGMITMGRLVIVASSCAVGGACP